MTHQLHVFIHVINIHDNRQMPPRSCTSFTKEIRLHTASAPQSWDLEWKLYMLAAIVSRFSETISPNGLDVQCDCGWHIDGSCRPLSSSNTFPVTREQKVFPPPLTSKTGSLVLKKIDNWLLGRRAKAGGVVSHYLINHSSFLKLRILWTDARATPRHL